MGREKIAVLRRVQRELGKAVIFERVKGSDVPVVSNLWGHYDRVGMVLGVERTALARTWGNLEDSLASYPQGLGPITPGEYEEIGLDELPISVHCEKDAGPYITGGVALARDPESGGKHLPGGTPGGAFCRRCRLLALRLSLRHKNARAVRWTGQAGAPGSSGGGADMGENVYSRR